MKIYIPFNSNDFNSIFTTLTLSPSSFYPNRKYSFRRSTLSLLNDNEDFLVAYDQPIFHNKEFDKDYGYPVLLQLDINLPIDKFELVFESIRYTVIEKTLYLFDDFKLLFRREKELNDTLAKSLKSIETKFSVLAKNNSLICTDAFYVSDIPKLLTPTSNPHISSTTFFKERIFNRISGAVIGSSIAFANAIPREWHDILLLFRSLNNSLSLYLNKIGDSNEFEKKQVFDIIEKIIGIYSSIESLDESLMLSSSFNSEFLSSLKQHSINKIPLFKLILDGLLYQPNQKLPIHLKFEKLKRSIAAKHNIKYPQNYIDKVSTAFSELQDQIDFEISKCRTSNKIRPDFLIQPKFDGLKLGFEVPDGLSLTEKKYLIETLIFFVNNDNIHDVEAFFTRRKEILVELANHYKSNIEEFSNSKDRDYLIDLLKSFDSLRSSFKIDQTNNEIVKSIAVLFLLGRDLLKYIENCERENISNPIIYFSIWGAVYGAAVFPKTLTESITDDVGNIASLISALKASFINFSDLSGYKELDSLYFNNDNIKIREGSEILLTADNSVDSNLKLSIGEISEEKTNLNPTIGEEKNKHLIGKQEIDEVFKHDLAPESINTFEIQKKNVNEEIVDDKNFDEYLKKESSATENHKGEIHTKEIIRKTDNVQSTDTTISMNALLLLEEICEKQKVKFSDLMKLSKDFKKQADVEKIISGELLGKVKIVREGKIQLAVFINNM